MISNRQEKKTLQTNNYHDKERTNGQQSRFWHDQRFVSLLLPVVQFISPYKLPVFLSPIYPIYLDSIHIAICKKLKTTIICLCVNFFILITVPDHQIVINILIMYKISPTLKVCGKLRRASISGRMLLIHSRMIKGESIRDV